MPISKLLATELTIVASMHDFVIQCSCSLEGTTSLPNRDSSLTSIDKDRKGNNTKQWDISQHFNGCTLPCLSHIPTVLGLKLLSLKVS